MAEDLRDAARKYREGKLVQSGEPEHAIVTREPGYPPTAGEFLAGPSQTVSVHRRQDGRWDIEFVHLVSADPSGS